MEHTPEGGTITVSYTNNPLYAQIQIRDNGCGIAKEDLPHIFERFYKGKNAGPDSVGIGLAMSGVILEQQGARKMCIRDRSAILRAEADRESQIKRAEGEAEAILKVRSAIAEGVKMLNDATPTQPVIAIKALEAFEKVADGKATKIIIPSEIQGMAGLAASLKELVVDDQKKVD